MIPEEPNPAVASRDLPDERPCSPNTRTSMAVAAMVRAVHFSVPAAGALMMIGVLAYTGLGLLRGSVSPGSEIFRSSSLPVTAADVETYLPHALLLWAIAGAALGHAARRLRRTRFACVTLSSEISLQRWGTRLGLVACLSLYLFSLARVWTETGPIRGGANRPYDLTPYSSLLGNIPWSDASAYYGSARMLLDVGRMDDWSARQPLNAALLAVRLRVTGLDLRAATLLQVILLAFATFLASRAIGVRFGAWSAIASTALMFAFGRMYFASTLAESLGLSLGAIGLSLLVRAIADRDDDAAAAGLGTVALSMSARPGAMFVIPCIFVALFARGHAPRRRRVTSAILAVALIVAGFAWTPLVNALYGSAGGMAGANFSYYAAGLAMGGRPQDAMQRYAEPLNQLPSERDKAMFLYARAAELVRANPRLLLEGLSKSGRAFFADIEPMLGRLALIDTPALGWTEVALLAIGTVAFFFGRKHDVIFWTSVWVGLGLSAPLIFSGAGWRPFASTWPLVAAFVSLGVAGELPRAMTPPRARRPPWRDAEWLCVVAIAILALAGPWVAHAISQRPALQGCAIDARDPVIVSRNVAFEPAAAVSTVGRGAVRGPGIPTFGVRRYRRLVNDSAMEDAPALLAVPAGGFVVFDAYDYAGHRLRQLIGPADLLDVSGPWIWMRTAPYSFYFQRVTEFGPFSGCQSIPRR
ncbi:MAG TPA: hypothetical protein VGI12_15055 [Vicinamibacterales bacterium]